MQVTKIVKPYGVLLFSYTHPKFP